MLYISNLMLEINNIMELNMKKGILAIILSLLVLGTVILWFINTKDVSGIWNLIPFPIILIIVIFGFVVGIKRIKSVKRGQPAEDELSKKLLHRASSVSYYISIYVWLLIMYLSDSIELETHSLIGAGILAMAIVFVFCWLYFRYFGLKDA